MFLILYGRSGSGKSTIENMLCSLTDFSKIVSYTSRQPRDSEIDGVDYNFITKNQILMLKENDELMECTEYSGNLYAAPKITEKDGNKVAVIETNGIRQILKYYEGKKDAPKICVIKLDASRETVEKRIPDRLDRIENDEIVFSDENSADIVDYTVDANNDMKLVLSDVLSIIKYIQSDKTDLKSIAFAM